MKPVKIYEILGKDLSGNSWLFYEEHDALKVKQCVQPFMCSCCGKFPEEKVIVDLGVALRFTTPYKHNAFYTSDDWLVVDESTAEGLRSCCRCQLVEVGAGYFAVLPERYAVNDATAGFEFHGEVCSICNRPHEAVVGPLASSHELPADVDVLWSTERHNESVKGARLGVWCDSHDLRLIKRILGKRFEYTQAL